MLLDGYTFGVLILGQKQSVVNEQCELSSRRYTVFASWRLLFERKLKNESKQTHGREQIIFKYNFTKSPSFSVFYQRDCRLVVMDRFVVTNAFHQSTLSMYDVKWNNNKNTFLRININEIFEFIFHNNTGTQRVPKRYSCASFTE